MFIASLLFVLTCSSGSSQKMRAPQRHHLPIHGARRRRNAGVTQGNPNYRRHPIQMARLSNDSGVPLHDLVLDGLPGEYPLGSGTYYVGGHFYLGGYTDDLDGLKDRLKWYFLAKDPANEKFDPAALDWKTITDADSYHKDLALVHTSWEDDQGTRVDFVVRVPSSAKGYQLGVGIVGRNKNYDDLGHDEVEETSIVVAQFPKLKVGGVNETNTIVPVSLNYPWHGPKLANQTHILFANTDTAIRLNQVYGSIETDKDYPDLGKIPAQWLPATVGAPGHATGKKNTALVTDDSPFIMFVETDPTHTPESSGKEWSIVIRHKT
jgi:hypothetical protein